MAKVWTDQEPRITVKRDPRGILVAFATAFAMWALLITGVLGVILKILH